MKNSKVLSLLTAGALVVSSFSGLAMNGGVALAAADALASVTVGATQTIVTGFGGATDDVLTVVSSGWESNEVTAKYTAGAAGTVTANYVAEYTLSSPTKHNTVQNYASGAAATDITAPNTLPGAVTITNTGLAGTLPTAAAAVAGTVVARGDRLVATWPVTINYAVDVAVPANNGKNAVATAATKALKVVFSPVDGSGSGAATGAVKYAVFEAVDSVGNHYEDGANTLTVQIKRAKLATESDADYNEYIRTTVMKSLTINALWSADPEDRVYTVAGDGDTTEITITADNMVDKGDGSGKVAGKITDCGLELNGGASATSGASHPTMGLEVSALYARNDKTWTGKLIVTADGVVTKGGVATTYSQTMAINVKVLVKDDATLTLTAGSNNVNFTAHETTYATEQTPRQIRTAFTAYKNANNKDAAWNSLVLDNGETGTASLKWVVTATAGTVTEDNLKYSWSWVKDNKVDTDADSKWITDEEAEKIFELNGANTENATTQPNTYVLGGTYTLRGVVKTAAGTVLKATYVQVDLVAEAGEALTIVVNTSKLEKGYVEIPAATTEIKEVTAKVTRMSGTDVTDSVSYIVIPFNEYVNRKNNNTLANASSATGISMSKGVLTVRHSVTPGAYVVIAKDGKLDNYAIDEENLIQVKNADGLAVTGLEIDQPSVTITNLNSEKYVIATVLPTVYQSNGYTKVAAKSAEVDAVSFEIADPSIVDVRNTGKAQYLLSQRTMDNTWEFAIRGRKIGSTTVTLTTLDGGFTQVIDVVVLGEDVPEPTPEPEPEHKAGDAFTVDGVSVFVNADGKTLTVTDVTVVGKTATIPATVDGMDVTTIAAQAFKKSDAKTIYVKAAVTDIEKGAFKKAKTKKIFFYEPAALNTVAKNAFKGANIKVIGVGGSFSESAASQLKKAGASKVKNNGSAK